MASMSASCLAVSSVMCPEKPSICWFSEMNLRIGDERRTRRPDLAGETPLACFAVSIALLSAIFKNWSTMAFAPGTPSPHRWSQIRQLPLHLEIRSLADYEQAVSTGTGNAAVYLQEIDVLQGLRIADFLHVHFLMFEKVHPWAGQLRQPGQLMTFSGFPAADPQRILRELSMALIQAKELMDEAQAEEDGFQWLAAMAFLHIRFERIHPFRDGNGRVGRGVLSAQHEVVFGELPSFADQAAYRAALRFSEGGDLAPFMGFLGATSGLPAAPPAWTTRFRLAPRFLENTEDEPSLLDDIVWSRLSD
jgi:fido (protein-threonine AMPylation protein)